MRLKSANDFYVLFDILDIAAVVRLPETSEVILKTTSPIAAVDLIEPPPLPQVAGPDPYQLRQQYRLVFSSNFTPLSQITLSLIIRDEA